MSVIIATLELGSSWRCYELPYCGFTSPLTWIFLLFSIFFFILIPKDLMLRSPELSIHAPANLSIKEQALGFITGFLYVGIWGAGFAAAMSAFLLHDIKTQYSIFSDDYDSYPSMIVGATLLAVISTYGIISTFIKMYSKSGRIYLITSFQQSKTWGLIKFLAKPFVNFVRGWR